MKKQIAIILALMMSACHPAYAHKAPKGWEYDKDCCHDRDCNQVDEIRAIGPRRFEIKVTLVDGNYFFDDHLTEKENEAIKAQHMRQYTKIVDLDTIEPQRIRTSQDEFVHVCMYTSTQDPTLLCVYLPGGM